MTFAGSARMRIALLLAVAVTVICLPVPAQAAPGDPGDEGGTPSLRQALENAAKGYNDAKAKLANSVKRQAQIGREQKHRRGEGRRPEQGRAGSSPTPRTRAAG